jgi:ribose transport system permease protein
MSTAEITTQKAAGKFAVSERLKGQFQQLLAFASLVVIVVFFSVASPNFMTWSNITGILLAASIVGVLALGTTFVIITGGIDLSIGTGMTLAAVMTGVFLTYWSLPTWLGVVLAILVGAAIGATNGLLIAYFRIPPFIATLAMMLVARGLSLVIANTAPIYFPNNPDFNLIATGSIIPGISFPNGALIFLVVAVIAGVILNKTVLGRYDFSIGSNEEATALSGVNTKRWKVAIYSFAGLFTGLAGVLLASRVSSAQPALGMGYELDAIAAVVIGGTSLIGGKGSIVGTVIGALIMAVLNNGLQILSIKQEWQFVVVGLVILLAVYMDMLRRKEA